ncbi:MAG: hypothetical protein ACYCS7_00215 [Acidimicrobiales bacterium]
MANTVDRPSSGPIRFNGVDGLLAGRVALASGANLGRTAALALAGSISRQR